MDRDVILGERIVWQGRPRVLSVPLPFRVAALLLFAVSAISLCFALVITFSLGASPAESVLFAAWCAALGVLALQGPKIWLEKVEYLVTERHVVMQRGPFRRTIERSAISFVRICWSARSPGVGDMDLVRAVPTGALRRRLLLQLRGVAAPDRVWSIIRGVDDAIGAHRGDRPLAQRLDPGERVVWSARPTRTAHAFLPRGRRGLGVLALSAALFFTFAQMLTRSIPNVRALARAGLHDTPFALLVIGVGLAGLLVLGAAAYLAFDALIAPARHLGETRYLITNHRVLIQRGREELHLDRERIVDVIPTKSGKGLSHVFLVLDGPRARALAMGGAFGEDPAGQELRPVLESVEDAESVSRILLGPESRQAA